MWHEQATDYLEGAMVSLLAERLQERLLFKNYLFFIYIINLSQKEYVAMQYPVELKDFPEPACGCVTLIIIIIIWWWWWW